jgi:hypothetical protein
MLVGDAHFDNRRQHPTCFLIVSHPHLGVAPHEALYHPGQAFLQRSWQLKELVCLATMEIYYLRAVLRFGIRMAGIRVDDQLVEPIVERFVLSLR